MRLPELVAATEIAAHLGITRQRVQQLTHEPGFPEPAYRFSGGFTAWLLDDVRAWAERVGRDWRD